ncbi:MAG: AAA family ATPase [Bdellovibrionales bacterium]|nr:AAA family ATPase [Bdellovibrionales bacterium]
MISLVGSLHNCKLKIFFCVVLFCSTLNADNKKSDKYYKMARQAIQTFNASPELTIDNYSLLIRRTNRLGQYAFQQSEQALILRLEDEAQQLEESITEEQLQFLEVIAENLNKIATIRVSNNIHEVIDQLNDILQNSIDSVYQVLLYQVISRLNRAQINSEKKVAYEASALYSDYSDEEKKLLEEKSQIDKIEDQKKIRKERQDKQRRREDQLHFDYLAEEQGRRNNSKKKSTINETIEIEEDPGATEYPDFDSLSDIQSSESRALVVAEKVNALGSGDLLSPYLTILSNSGSDKMRASVNDIQLCVTEYFSDGRANARRFEQAPDIYARDEEVEKAIRILMRKKGGNPALMGNYYSGKTAVVQKLSDYISEGQYPKERAFKEIFDQAHIVRIDGLTFGLKQFPGLIMKNYLNAVLHLKKVANINIITYITNFEALPKEVINEVERALFQADSAKIIIEAQSNDFNMAFKNNQRIKDAFETIAIHKFSNEQIINLLKTKWLDDIQDTDTGYGVSIGFNEITRSEVLEAIVEISTKIYRSLGPIEASLRLLQDLAIKALWKEGVGAIVHEEMVYEEAQKYLGFPVNPLDGPAMANYLNENAEKANEEVKAQRHLVELTMDAWADLLEDPERSIRVGVYLGGSGAGKSELTKVIGKILFKNPDRVFTIPGSEVQKAAELWTWFGATNGYESAKETPGRLMEWLDDPAGGKYGGVLIIDEAEKADPKFWERLMEFFDTGRIVGGDGKARYANNLLVILTSNKGYNILVPKGIEHWISEKVKAHQKSFTEAQLKDIFSKKTPGSQESVIHPAVLNRIDFYGLAHLIDKENLLEIAELKANKWKNTILRIKKINVTISKELREHLVLTSYRIQDGFRSPGRQLYKYLNKALRHTSAKWKFKRGEHLSFDLEEDTEGRFFIKITSEDGQKLKIDAPEIKIDNPLENEKEMEKLGGLLDYLNSRVFGWEETNQAIFDAIFAYRSSPGEIRSRPLSLMLVGSTGTGKSELAKALANYLFGNDEAALVLNMGEIQTPASAAKFLGSNRNEVGHDELTELEAFVLAHEKTGGVILWDEISNMGGAHSQIKESLFKLFYGMIEEGSWTPAARNEPYDLSKFIFIFTGNDGEKLFQGLSADDLRLAVWKSNNKKERIREILREAGVPEAFLGRMADLVLAKPLSTETMKKVAHKLIAPIQEVFRKNNVQVEINPEELDQFVKSFFSQDSGARSVRSMSEDKLTGWISQLYLQVKKLVAKGDNLKIRIKVKDNLPQKAYVEDKAFAREVFVQLEAIVDDKVIGTLERDVSEYAPRKIRLSKRGAVVTAYHEASHANVNIPEMTGSKVSFITIKGSDGALGYARYDNLSNDVVDDNGTRTSTLLRMARLLAGQRGQQMAGYEPDAGWANDIKKVRQLAYQYFVEWGDPEDSSTLSLLMKENGDLQLKTDRLVDNLLIKINDFIEEADQLTQKLLLENWNAIEATKNALLQKGELSAEEFVKIREEALLNKTEWVINSEGKATKKSDLTFKDLILNPLKKSIQLKKSRAVNRVLAKAKIDYDQLAQVHLEEAFIKSDLQPNTFIYGNPDFKNPNDSSAKGLERCSRALSD